MTTGSIISAVAVLVDALLAGRAAALVLPSRATVLRGFLITAHEPCTAPDRTLSADATLETTVDIAINSNDCFTDECITATIAAFSASCVVSGGSATRNS